MPPVNHGGLFFVHCPMLYGLLFLLLRGASTAAGLHQALPPHPAPVSHAAPAPHPAAAASPDRLQRLNDLCSEMDSLNTAILLGKVNGNAATIRFQTLLAEIAGQAPALSKTPWVFPLQGYNYRAVGGTNGDDYSDKGYRYLDGNKHLAHPAHDIFIHDKNQDGLDDSTHQPVNVLAVTDGIVIACCQTWEPGSPLRGGKYIWIYHPQWQMITYYAHNGKIFVQPGDVVKRGQKVAEVGRTGFNAYPKRSPTHLHFSAFRVPNGLPVPFNPYPQLKMAATL
jgi:peptidoglycan LD-endopeptidase LytH